MSKEKVEVLVDQFTDEYGNIRNFVIAAVSEPFEEPLGIFDEWEEYPDILVKGVKLGWAICNPIDVFSEDLGKRIATGRAIKNEEYALYATKPGYINTRMIQAFLKQEAEYFKTNPEYKIAGYKRKK